MKQKPPTVVTDNSRTCDPVDPRVAAAASAKPPRPGGMLTAALGAAAGPRDTGRGGLKLLVEAFAGVPANRHHHTIRGTNRQAQCS